MINYTSGFSRDLIRLAVTPTLIVLLTAAASAGPAMLKDGPCPSGYHTSGNYCVGTENAPPALLKNGPCPSGYHTSGNYCLGNREAAPSAIPKRGPCPSGYHSSGNYCIGN